MSRKGFSTVFDAEKTACARGKDLRCSPKASRNIALTIKGMRLEDAKEFLEGVMEERIPVPTRVRNRKIKHRKGDGFGPGNYPVGAASRLLKILQNAENNAEYKDLETENLRILHASAYRGETQVRFKPRAHGRASPFFDHTTNVELVLGEDERLDEKEEQRDERREKGGVRRKSPKGKSEKAKPAEEKPAGDKPAAEKPAAEKPAGDKPAAEKPAAKKPAAEKPAGDKPAAAKPAEEKPAGDKPAAEKPAGDKPAAEKQAEEKPAAEKPEKPASEKKEES